MVRNEECGCMHTTSASWIPILEPSAANVCVLFIHCDLYIGHKLWKLDCRNDARYSSSNVDDFERPWFINRSFRNQRVGIYCRCWRVANGSHVDDYGFRDQKPEARNDQDTAGIERGGEVVGA